MREEIAANQRRKKRGAEKQEISLSDKPIRKPINKPIVSPSVSPSVSLLISKIKETKIKEKKVLESWAIAQTDSEESGLLFEGGISEPFNNNQLTQNTTHSLMAQLQKIASGHNPNNMYQPHKWQQVKRKLQKELTDDYLFNLIDGTELSMIEILDQFCEMWHKEGKTAPKHGYEGMARYFRKWAQGIHSRQERSKKQSYDSFLKGIQADIEVLCGRTPSCSENLLWKLRTAYKDQGKPSKEDLIATAKLLIDAGQHFDFESLLANWTYYHTKLTEWRQA